VLKESVIMGGPAEYRQSRLFRVFAVVAGAPALLGIAFFEAGGALLIAYFVLHWIFLVYIALLPKICVSDDGIVGDSMLLRQCIPWRNVNRIHARMSIVVELVDGRMIALRAVERARASVIFKEESVVDRAAAQMEDARARWQPTADDRVLLRRWPTLLTRDAVLIVYLPLLLMLAVRLVVSWM
jgi:hypothetical protein